MGNLTAERVTVLVPAQDFAMSKAFYAALGWTVTDVAPGLARMELAGTRLMLQDFYVKDHAGNFVIQVRVQDAHAWHEHILAVLKTGKFGEARSIPPRQEPWSPLTTYAIDPSGILIHFAQWPEGQ